MTSGIAQGESRLLRLLLPPRGRDGLLRDTAWNALVNGASGILSAILLLFASRFCGAYWCGVCGIALAMSQQLFPLGNFSMGNYQASDLEERHSFDDYVDAKAIAIAAMAVAGVGWLAFGSVERDKALAFLPLFLYQASDAIGNVFFSRYQQKGRLDTACRVRFAKVAVFAFVYVVVLGTTRSLIGALAAAAFVHVSFFVVLDRPLLQVFGPFRPRWPRRAAWAILLACSPIAANSFLVMVVNNAPRFALDKYLAEEDVAAFSALFMVSFAVAICGDFLMNPQIVPLADALRRRDRISALRTIGRTAAVIAALGVAGLAVGATFGVRVLSWIFSLDLAPYRIALCILLAGGVLLAFGQLAQTVLIVLRRQAWMLPGVALAALCALLASGPLVARHGIRGAALAYLAAELFPFVIPSVFATIFFHQALPRRGACETGAAAPLPPETE